MSTYKNPNGPRARVAPQKSPPHPADMNAQRQEKNHSKMPLNHGFIRLVQPHVRKTVHYFRHREDSYVTERDLKHCHISLSALDLSNNSSKTGLEQFVKPVSAQEVRQLLDETRPWDIPVFGQARLNPDFCLGPDKRGAALHVFVLRWLEETKDNRTHSLWLKFNLSSHMSTMSSKLTPWNGDTERWWPTDFAVSKRDATLPHCICFLTSKEPLKDNVLGIGELWQILLHTWGRLLHEKKYSNHVIAPITVISASGETLRIVHGWVDTNSTIVAQISPIVDLSKPGAETSDEYMMILGWILSDAVGDTERAHLVSG